MPSACQFDPLLWHDKSLAIILHFQNDLTFADLETNRDVFGLRVPDDFSIVGFDNIVAAAESVPPLTTVKQPGIEIGRRTATMLYQLLQGEVIVPQTKMDVEFILRGSTGPAPQQSVP